MKQLNHLIILFLILSCCLPIVAEKRKPQLSMQDLTDPNSPSFVPFPFPKNRKEVLDDLYHYIKTHNMEGNVTTVDGSIPEEMIILADLLSPGSIYKIGAIIKVTNRLIIPDKYHWLIHVMDPQNNVIMRITVQETGLVGMIGVISEKTIKSMAIEKRGKLVRLKKKLMDFDLKSKLSVSLGRTVSPDEIKQIKRISYPSTMGGLLFPVCEIKLKSGTFYYYSEIKDTVYEIDGKLPWKKNNGRRPSKLSMVNHEDFLPDKINDEIVVLKRLNNKNNK